MPPLILGTLLWSGVVLLATAFGRRLLLLMQMRTQGAIERGIVAATLGLGALQVIPFLLFAFGIGRPIAFRIAALVLTIVLWRDIRTTIAALTQWILARKQFQRWEIILIAVFCLLSTSIFFRSVCPVTDGDSLAYHLTCALRTLDAGRFVYLPTLVYTNWPVSTEMLFAFERAIHPAAPVAIIPFTFGSLAVAGALLFGRRIGGPIVGWTAATLLLVYPRFWWEMATAMVDLSTAAYAMMAVYAFSRSREGIDSAGRWLSLSAVFAGLAGTTKLNGVWVVPSMAIVVLLAGRPGGWCQAVGASLRYIGVAAAIVVPWFIKTWIITGNPLYPAFYRFLGGYEWTADGWERFHTYHWQFNTPTGMEPTPSVLFWIHWAYAGVALCVALAVIVFTRKSNPAISAAARFSSFFTVAICAFSFYTLRYLFAALPPAFVCVAFATRGRQRVFAPIVCVGATVLAYGIGIKHVKPDLATAIAVATGKLSGDDYLSQKLPDYDAAAFANRSLPDNSRIVVGALEVRTAYYRFPAFWSDYWRQDSLHYDSKERLLSDMRRLGVTHMMLEDPHLHENTTHLADRVRVKVELPLLAEVAGSHGEKLFEANGFTLYRLRLVN